jgi:hypothetical protein
LYAFAIPEIGDGFEFVGQGDNAIQPDYLFDQWCRGRTPEGYAEQIKLRLWTLAYSERMAQLREWEEGIRAPIRQSIFDHLEHIRFCTEEINYLHGKVDQARLARANIIGCTTWGAIKYADLLFSQDIHVVMAEEAAEILEAYVMAALTLKTQHLSLIGDHRQLRPKVKNYNL